MSDFEIRPIDETLFEQCWQLRIRALKEHPDAFGAPWAKAAALSPTEVRANFELRWIGGDNDLFVAVNASGEIGGMTGTYREDGYKNQHRMHIWGVYVAPEYRGLGLSSRLLDAAIGYCRRVEGVLQVELQVVSQNRPAVRSYERAGFVRWGRLPRADILDDVVLDNDFMVLMLDTASGTTEQQTEGTNA